MSLKIKILQQLIRRSLAKKFNDRPSLDKWQRSMIDKHIRQIIRHSSFYKKRQKQYGHWSKYPIINKSIFMKNFNEINTQGIDLDEAYHIAFEAERTRDFSPMIGDITVGLSSGTSGNRGIFLVSIQERAQWVAYILLHLLGFSFRRRKVAFFLRANSNLYTSTQSKLLDFSFFDLKNPVHQNLTRLKKLNPHILIAQPSMLIDVAKFLEKNPTAFSQLERVISVAEVLEETDKQYLQKVFNKTIHQAYQCTEGFLARTCEYGTLHFNEDLVRIEKKYIDDQQYRYHPIITDFTRSSQPLIRYELNDIIIDKKEPCPCGSVFQAIEKIEGRSDDVFIFKTKNNSIIKVFPDFIRRAIISSSDHIQQYIVEQTHIDTIQVYLKSQLFDEVCQKVTTQMTQMLREYNVDPININYFDTLPEIQDTKLRRVKRSWVYKE